MLPWPRKYALFEALATARAHANQSSRDVWQFALEIQALGHLGAGHHELRWLLAEGLVEQRLEITTPVCPERRFQPLANLSLPPGTCFVLTDKGARWFAELSAPDDLNHSQQQLTRLLTNGGANLLPSWDRHHRVLMFAGEIVKAFRVPAANQEVILQAFEAAGWPPCIADPLADRADLEPRQRLAYAIKALNRKHTACRLRFFGDGTGQRVCWKRVASQILHRALDRT